MPLKREGYEIGICKLPADLPRLNKCVVGFGRFAPVYQAISDRKKEIPFLHTFGIVLKQSLCPRKPAAGLCNITA